MNVIGSNTADTLLILDVAALILPVRVPNDGFRRDAVTLTAVTLLMGGLRFNPGLPGDAQIATHRLVLPASRAKWEQG